MLDEDLLLVVEVLADALGYGNRRAFQLQHTERNAVDVEHYVRALGVGLGIAARDGHFLCDGEVVPLRVLPVDEPNVLSIVARTGLYLHGVAQHVVHGAVTVVETLAGVARRLAEDVKCPRDERLVVALLVSQEGSQQLLFDVAVALALGPVAEIVVAELLSEQPHHACLSLLLDLADGAHGYVSTRMSSLT